MVAERGEQELFVQVSAFPRDGRPPVIGDGFMQRGQAVPEKLSWHGNARGWRRRALRAAGVRRELTEI